MLAGQVPFSLLERGRSPSFPRLFNRAPFIPSIHRSVDGESEIRETWGNVRIGNL